MGSKNKPGAHDCYANALDDEPMFVLLGRDPQAPELVRAWADKRASKEPAKADEAYACAAAMEGFRKDVWLKRPKKIRPGDVVRITRGSMNAMFARVDRLSIDDAGKVTATVRYTDHHSSTDVDVVDLAGNAEHEDGRPIERGGYFE